MGTTASNIVDAAEQGDVSRVREFLSSERSDGSAPSSVDERRHRDNSTALHMASLEGYVDIVEELLSRGADRFARDSIGFTALHRAVQEDQLDVCRALLDIPDSKSAGDANYDARQQLVNAVNHFGVSPLHWACVWNRDECARLLVEQGAVLNSKQLNHGQSALHVAAVHESAECAKVILTLAGDPDARSALVRQTDKDGHTPLDIASPRIKQLLTDFSTAIDSSVAPSSSSSLSLSPRFDQATRRLNSSSPSRRQTVQVVRDASDSEDDNIRYRPRVSLQIQR
jgi:ankyrin repeat protein